MYQDNNNSTEYDDGDEPLVGTSLQITDSLGSQTVPTDSNGEYSADVAPGPVTIVVVDPPEGSSLTEGTDPTTVEVPTNGTASDIDGYFVPGKVSGTVYQDNDNNAMYDDGAGDEPIVGVNIQITDSTGNMQVVPTDSNGEYSAFVAPGDVEIVVLDPPAGSIPTEGTDPTTVNVSAGGTATDIDGYYLPPSGLDPTPAPVDP